MSLVARLLNYVEKSYSVFGDMKFEMNGYFLKDDDNKLDLCPGSLRTKAVAQRVRDNSFQKNFTSK